MVAGGADQGHDALLDAVLGEEAVRDRGDHVDECVADADDLQGFRHGVLSSQGQRSAIRQAPQRGLRAVQV